MKTWLITGCSTGLGRALAEVVLDRGDRAVITARNVSSLRDLADAHSDTALALPLDVTQPESIELAVASVERRFGRVDVLVNNAGYGYRAAVEEGVGADVERLFDTNLFGPIALIKAVLPGMRTNRSGVIVNVSSIGARSNPEGSGYYSASKAALEAITLSLRKEVDPLGIRAFFVEPGSFRTDFIGRSLTQSSESIADYAGTAGRRRKENDHSHGTQRGDPVKGAMVIIAAVEAPHPPRVLLLGPDAAEKFRTAERLLLSDVDEWEALSASTDFVDA